MIGTSTADEHNPLPKGTAGEGGNEPLTEEEVLAAAKRLSYLDTFRKITMQRISKHRAGRTKPLTKEQRRKRDRRGRVVTQARKHIFLEHQADARALQSAFESKTLRESA